MSKPAAKAGPEGTEVPPYSVTTHYKKHQIHVRVILHKIPDKFIVLNPTEKVFHLDTLKYTKKYFLEFDYPQQAEVDPNECQASIEGGVVEAIFPIKKILDTVTNSMVKAVGDEYTQIKAKASPKAKKSALSKPAEPAEIEEVKAARQQKKKPVELDTAMDIIDSINNKQEAQIKSKLKKEEKKIAFLAQKEAARVEKKEKREGIKRQVTEDYVAKLKQQKKAEKEAVQAAGKKRKGAPADGQTSQSKRTKRNE